MQDSRIAGIRNASEKRGQPHYHAKTDSWLDDHRARTRSSRVAYWNIVIHNPAIAIGSDTVRNVGTPTALGASNMKGINYIQLNKIDSAAMAFREALQFNPNSSDAVNLLRKVQALQK